MTRKITVHKVQPGAARVGCDPSGVQVFYKESMNLGGNPNLVHLSDLLKRHGFQVQEGDNGADSPLRYLCVARADGRVTRDDVLKVFVEDQAIDLTNVDKVEGNRGDDYQGDE